MLAVRIYLSNAGQLIDQLEAVSGMNIDIHLYVDEGVWSTYEAFAIHDVLTNLYKGDMSRVSLFYRQGAGMLNLVAAASVPRENRFIYNHALCFFHDLAGFGFGSYKDLEVAASQTEKDHATVLEIMSVGWDISPEDAAEYMKSGKRLRSEDLIALGAKKMEQINLDVEYTEPMSLREKLKALLASDETSPGVKRYAKECLNEE